MRATGTIFIRDLIFSDIVPNTIMIFNHNFKNDKNLITTNTVPLTSKILKKRKDRLPKILEVPIRFEFFFAQSNLLIDKPHREGLSVILTETGAASLKFYQTFSSII